MEVEKEQEKGWLCPYCTGRCSCSRCMRLDTITRIKANFFSYFAKEESRERALEEFLKKK